MMTVNSLIQEACEDLNMVADGEPVSGDLAASAEGCLNRAIASLNADSYISLTVRTRDVHAAGNIVFRKLEDGEVAGGGVIDQEPPDTVQDVARLVGSRYVRLTPAERFAVDRAVLQNLPTVWNYGVELETAPSGRNRRVGRIRLNGTYPCDIRVYENDRLPQYRLGDTIYLSELYYSLILYSLELRLVKKYKLFSYQQSVEEDLAAAMKSIDSNTSQNRPMVNDGLMNLYTKSASDLLAGTGM